MTCATTGSRKPSGIERVAVLREPAHVDTYYEALDAQAAVLGITLLPAPVDAAEQLEAVFASIRAQALFVVPSRLITLLTRRIVGASTS